MKYDFYFQWFDTLFLISAVLSALILALLDRVKKIQSVDAMYA
jgi:hypothetical protein